MRLLSLTLALASLTSVLGIPTDVTASKDECAVAELAQQAYRRTIDSIAHNPPRPPQYGGHSETNKCSPRNVRVRREWGSLSKKQRRAYIKAAKCLQQKPALTPSSVSSGAKSRFDDFIVTHINQTQRIHYTANFLTWHRYFVWLYEEALRKECGYRGYQPYWDWAKTARTGLLASPIFDGSDTSMSGNGVLAGNRSDVVLGGSPGLPAVYLPAGSGGGCVKKGPFRGMQVHLGPAALSVPGGATLTAPSGNPLDLNSRCLKRSLTDAVNRRFANGTSVLNVLTQPHNVYDFQMQMQGIPGSGDIGVHGGGHYALGGDPGRDVSTSPGDPMFYLHHANIDRTWWIWQMQSPYQRQFTNESISGTRTFLNTPPSANATLDDLLDYGYAAGPALKIRDALSTVHGPFCYVYL